MLRGATVGDTASSAHALLEEAPPWRLSDVAERSAASPPPGRPAPLPPPTWVHQQLAAARRVQHRQLWEANVVADADAQAADLHAQGTQEE